ncbi:hypothetical protein [Pedobacter sp. L105]|uniref:hypothetical protein n=1 Tax=Pedobacter sp. L105 TaxID=1641871 RepID=UPI00131EA1B2|nr:hypothetical protein [Pedobacter sp. L105]
MSELIYQGNVYWAHAEEIEAMGISEKYIGRQFSFAPPLSRHKGQIYLFSNYILLEADEEVVIPLKDITQLYIGFDDVFTAASVKTFGMLWRPLRIIYGENLAVYLIIDYNYFTSNNSNFFTLVQDMLS